MPHRNKVILTHSQLNLRKDGILEIKLDDTTHFTIKEVFELTDAIEKMPLKKQHPIMVIAGKDSILNPEGRRHISRKDGLKNINAHAFVIQSFAQKVVANIYMAIDKPFKPTRFFLTVSEAEKWLESFVNQE